MRKIVLTLVAGIAAASVSACATDNTPKVKMTGAEIENTLKGNTLQRSFSAGPNTIFSSNYYSPNGVMLSQNSKGEQGAANWSIKDDQLCLKWTKKGFDWVVSDSCTSYSKAGENRIESSAGTVWTIKAGNPENLK